MPAGENPIAFGDFVVPTAWRFSAAACAGERRAEQSPVVKAAMPPLRTFAVLRERSGHGPCCYGEAGAEPRARRRGAQAHDREQTTFCRPEDAARGPVTGLPCRTRCSPGAATRPLFSPCLPDRTTSCGISEQHGPSLTRSPVRTVGSGTARGSCLVKSRSAHGHLTSAVSPEPAAGRSSRANPVFFLALRPSHRRWHRHCYLGHQEANSRRFR